MEKIIFQNKEKNFKIYLKQGEVSSIIISPLFLENEVFISDIPENLEHSNYLIFKNGKYNIIDIRNISSNYSEIIFDNIKSIGEIKYQDNKISFNFRGFINEPLIDAICTCNIKNLRITNQILEPEIILYIRNKINCNIIIKSCSIPAGINRDGLILSGCSTYNFLRF